MPEFDQISHVVITVTDIEASRLFWTEVMGFVPLLDREGFCLVGHPATLVAIGLKDHGGVGAGAFDERRPGLDHLAFAVTDRAALEAWERHLSEAGIEYSPIEESEMGWHLNFRAPDKVPLEFFVLGDAAAGEVLPPGDS